MYRDAKESFYDGACEIYVQYVAHPVLLFGEGGEEKIARVRAYGGGKPHNAVDENIREERKKKREEKGSYEPKYYNCRDLCGGK